MNLRNALGAVGALALLISGAAFADNMTVKDSTGATITVCTKSQSAIEHPCHVFEGQRPDGTVGPIQTDSGGNVIISGGPTAANQTATQANPGVDSAKATGVQGVAGGKPVPVANTATPSVIIGKVSAVDSGGTDATDNANHAIRVNVVAGGVGGGPVTVADGADVSQGAQGDAACGSDNGTCSGIALWKRNNQRVSAVVTALGTPLQAGGNIGNTSFGISGTLPAYATAPTFLTNNSVTYSAGAYDGTNNKNPAGFQQAIADAAISPAAGATRYQRLAAVDKSGTVTTGAAYNVAIAQNSNRNGCTIQNPTTASEVLLIEDRAVATPGAGNSWTISPGGTYTCGSTGNVNTNGIKVSAATSGHAFIGSEF